MARKREHYAAIVELRANGLSLVATGRELGVSTSTVHRFPRTASVEEKPVPVANRSTKIDRFRPYLNERRNAGVTNAVFMPSPCFRVEHDSSIGSADISASMKVPVRAQFRVSLT